MIFSNFNLKFCYSVYKRLYAENVKKLNLVNEKLAKSQRILKVKFRGHHIITIEEMKEFNLQ